MTARFDDIIGRVLASEGGYVWNPADPGGETNFGISRRAYPWLNIKDLTREAAVEIYRRDFWSRVGGESLPDALAFQVLDAAVNHGVGNASRWLQRAAGVAEDGVIGPVTRTAITVMDPCVLVLRFNAERLKFYAALSTFSTFGRGWVRRVAGNLNHAAEDAAP